MVDDEEPDQGPERPDVGRGDQLEAPDSHGPVAVGDRLDHVDLDVARPGTARSARTGRTTRGARRDEEDGDDDRRGAVDVVLSTLIPSLPGVHRPVAASDGRGQGLDRRAE